MDHAEPITHADIQPDSVPAMRPRAENPRGISRQTGGLQTLQPPLHRARPEETAPASRPTPPLDPAPMADDLDTDLTQFWDPEPSAPPPRPQKN